MQIRELIPMTGDELKADLERRGWNAERIAQRWCISKRRAQQIQGYKEGERPRYYDDAIHGLPLIKARRKAPIVVPEMVPMTSDQLKAELAVRGWTAETLALRWGITRRRAQQILSYKDGERPCYYDDAIRGLPLLKKKRAKPAASEAAA